MRRGCRPGIDELFNDWIDAEVQSLERPCAEEHKVARFSEDDVVSGEGSSCVHDGNSGPAF